MKLRINLIVTFLILGVGQSTARAAVIFADDFESYADTAAMNAVWNGQVAPGTLSASGNPTNAMEHPGGTSQVAPITGTTPSDSNPIIWEFDLFDTLTATRNTGGLRNSAASALLEMGVYNSLANPPGGTVAGYGLRAVFVGESQSSGGPDDVDWITFSPNLARVEGWHHFRATIGGSSILFQLDLGDDGTVDASRTIYTSTGATEIYNSARFGGPSNLSSAGPLRFDNLSIRHVPEPATFAVLGLSMVGIMLAGRRRPA